MRMASRLEVGPMGEMMEYLEKGGAIWRVVQAGRNRMETLMPKREAGEVPSGITGVWFQVSGFLLIKALQYWPRCGPFLH